MHSFPAVLLQLPAITQVWLLFQKLLPLPGISRAIGETDGKLRTAAEIDVAAIAPRTISITRIAARKAKAKDVPIEPAVPSVNCPRAKAPSSKDTCRLPEKLATLLLFTLLLIVNMPTVHGSPGVTTAGPEVPPTVREP